MTHVLLAVGANLGDRHATLEQALSALACLENTHLVARSRWHETQPVGGPDGQPGFLNGAVLLDIALTAEEIASQLRKIEHQLGRKRHERWDARLIDLDLLLYGNQTIVTPALEIPHPRMAFRRFVLDPACEIAGALIHPPSRWTLAALRWHWQTQPRTISVESPDKQLAGWLRSELGRHLSMQASDQPSSQTIELVDASANATMVIQLGIAAPRREPVVNITSTDQHVILQEAVAAIAAAWPIP